VVTAGGPGGTVSRKVKENGYSRPKSKGGTPRGKKKTQGGTKQRGREKWGGASSAFRKSRSFKAGFNRRKANQGSEGGTDALSSAGSAVIP